MPFERAAERCETQAELRTSVRATASAFIFWTMTFLPPNARPTAFCTQAIRCSRSHGH